jgi:diguanylate cyclase (GGDEF)-like protein
VIGISRVRRAGSTRRLFTIYAAVSLVPVLVLGLVLLQLIGRQADARGLGEGRSEASIIAHTTVAPLLDGDDLRHGLDPDEAALLRRSVDLVIRNGQVLRLRVRDIDGNVIFADDSSTGGPDDEALLAAQGRTVAELTYLNADDGDNGPRGPRVVEVYEPLNAAQSGTRIGVLELYLPYAPIASTVAEDQRTITVALSAGLLALWLSLLCVSVSVTGRLRREARRNAHLANDDALTGLPNRGQFAQLTAQQVRGATAESQVAVAVIDLDRFKEINDALGHDNGDDLLVLLAARLTAEVGDQAILARIGGDEFGILMSDVRNTAQVHRLLTRVRKVLAEPAQVGGLPLAIEASVGFALAPQDGTDGGQLIQRADVAMYVAKQRRLGVVGYLPEQDHYDSSALRLVAELGAALENEELVLHFQPKVDAESGRVSSLEALVRWQHPTRGLLFPDTFLPAVEQTELIEPLTWWVLRNATLALGRLDPSGRLGVAVNISARSLTRVDFADDLLAVLAGTGTDPRRVILEVTETLLLVDPPRAAATLRRLHDAGFQISVDDFGAGQTSLSYLAMLPISELKVDKSFVLSMLHNERNAAIVRSVIELGHSLGCTVTAEGVETAAILTRLREYGCDTVQGYLLSRPLAFADVGRYLGEATTAPAHTRPAPQSGPVAVSRSRSAGSRRGGGPASGRAGGG